MDGFHQNLPSRRETTKTTFYLLQLAPGSLLHVNCDTQHVVERGEEVMTDIQGELLDAFDLIGRVTHKRHTYMQ